MQKTILGGFLVVLISIASAFAADDSEYKPEGKFYSMEAHFRWCADAKAPTARLRRYERFWELQAPEKSDGYDDSLHVRTVRRCAYRLAQLYNQLGRRRDCLRILRWLEAEDDTLGVGVG